MIAPTPRVNFERLDAPLALVGRNQASTFAGLCGEHDAELFREIEASPFDLNNEWHRFLVTYRTAIRQLHADISAAIRLQAGYLEQVDRGRLPGDVPSAPGLEATKWLTWAYETYQLKRELDLAYLKRDPAILKTRYRSEEGLEPTVAANSIITNEVPGRPASTKPPAFLTVLPQKDRLFVVVGRLASHGTVHRRLLRHLFSADQRRFLLRLSRLILKNCENFVLSPSFYDSLSLEERDRIQTYFLETITSLEKAGVEVPSLFRRSRSVPKSYRAEQQGD